MPSISTKLHARRAVAEIELLLVIPVLLTILFLAGGALELGAARLANIFHAEEDAYTQVTIGQNLTPAPDAPIDGINSVRPALPNRLDMGLQQQRVAFTFGNVGAAPVNLTDKAWFLDPAWHFAAWPNSADQNLTRSWFESYVEESHPPDLVYSLGLQPPWRP